MENNREYVLSEYLKVTISLYMLSESEMHIAVARLRDLQRQAAGIEKFNKPRK
jgi:hypothetical protein